MAIKSKAALRRRTRLREAAQRRLAEEWPGYHLNALKFVRPGALYVSARKREYYIEQHGNFWTIHKYKGGEVSKTLKGLFSTFREAEQRLINYLKQTDKFGNKARYPGKNG